MTIIKDALWDAHSLIEDEESWTKHAFARDADKKAVGAHTPEAECFCMLGAVQRVVEKRNMNNFEQRKLRLWLDAAVVHVTGTTKRSVVGYNDDKTTTHADVLKLLEWAAENAK